MREDVDVTDALLLSQPAFLDVRAPVEFTRGAVPGAVNLPILDDDQRAEVGTVYANAGQDAAIERGLAMATLAVRTQRLAAWTAHARVHPNGFLYCLRGGLRSRTAQAWLSDQHVHYPLVRGGYKALRTHYLAALDRLCDSAPLIVVTGQTGCGKTELITAWNRSLDLEGRARHRGSAFGGTFSTQPGQIDFENRVTLDWLLLAAASDEPVLIEAESQLIGRLFIPVPLQEAMQAASSVALIAPFDARVARLRHDYVDHALAHFRGLDHDDPYAALNRFVVANLERIRRRLGGAQTDELVAAVPGAVHALKTQADTGGFDAVIATLLTRYYDRLYDHKARSRPTEARFTGTHGEILDWLGRQQR
ncbi:MAG: tRNA 2-selenouridine(34) synthase MnmH [Pseudomonadota bacterium]